MMRSLYSGISGLKNHQTRMDVIGNNIANVNTIGFKTSRVVFQDIYSQTLRAGSAGTAPMEDGTGGMGGTNPAQIGLGVKLGSIDVIHTSAPTQRTDNPLDLALDGDGYFIVQNPQTGTNYYSRAGNFRLDDKGNLVTSDGFFIMGYNSIPKYTQMVTKVQALNFNGEPLISSGDPVYFDITPISPKDMQILQNIVELTRQADAAPAVKSAVAAVSKAAADAATAGKTNAEIVDAAKAEVQKYDDAINTATTGYKDLVATAKTDLTTAKDDVNTHKTGLYQQAVDDYDAKKIAYDQAKADYDADPTNLALETAFNAAESDLDTAKDELDTQTKELKRLEKLVENKTIALERAESDLASAEAALDAVTEIADAAEYAAMDPDATPDDITAAVAEAALAATKAADKAVVDASNAKKIEEDVLEIVRDAIETAMNDGTYKGPALDNMVDPPVTLDSLAQMVVDGLKAGATKQFSIETGEVQTGSTADKNGGLVPINLDGYVSIAVDFDGTIYGIKDDIRTPIAVLGVAMFANPSGLEKAGTSLYRKSGASGEPMETSPQVDGAGLINGGGLEMSNVDLAGEFTDMIVTQRGYQANSRIITVSDSMLEELVNLKR